MPEFSSDMIISSRVSQQQIVVNSERQKSFVTSAHPRDPPGGPKHSTNPR